MSDFNAGRLVSDDGGSLAALFVEPGFELVNGDGGTSASFFIDASQPAMSLTPNMRSSGVGESNPILRQFSDEQMSHLRIVAAALPIS